MKVQPELTDAPVTPWVAYTPTFTGFGTVSNVTARSRRVGQNLEIEWDFVSGTSTATEARISMGFNGVDGGLTAASNYPANTSQAGLVYTTVASAYMTLALIEASVGYMTFSAHGGSNAGLTKLNGNTLFSSGVRYSGRASIRIQGW